MDALRRLSGLAASLAGMAGQLALVSAMASDLRMCLCWSHGDPFVTELHVGWEPYIDNPGVGDQASRERRCPEGQSAGSRFRLDHAPLPAGFDAHGYPAGDILACVKLRADGSVEAVRIVAGTGRARIDSRLLRTIGGQWRFRPVDGFDGPRRWQRVRLNFASAGATVREPPIRE